MKIQSRTIKRFAVYILLGTTVIATGLTKADAEKLIMERSASGQVSMRIEPIDCGRGPVRATPGESMPFFDDLVDQYTPELVVLADAWFSWSVPPACSNIPVYCSGNCGGPWGHEDFDESWGPLSTPSNLRLVVGWKPNGCTSEDGRLDFFAVPDVCGGEGTLIHSVSGDLGHDYENFTYSPEIDVSGILTPGQTYYIRVVEEEDGVCGGADYTIYAIGVFSTESDPCDLNSDGVFSGADIRLFVKSCRSR